MGRSTRSRTCTCPDGGARRFLPSTADRFRELIDYAGPLGLLAEEIVPDGEGRHPPRELPQAFSHVSVVNSALYIGRMGEPETPGPVPLGIWLGDGLALPDSTSERPRDA